MKTNHMLFSDATDRHHTATIMWKLSWTDGCLSYGLAKQGSTARPLQSPDDPLWFFMCRFVKDEVYILPVSITLIKFRDWIHIVPVKTEKLNNIFCIVPGKNWNDILMCAAWQTEHMLVWKTFCLALYNSVPLTYVAITF